MNCAEQRRNIKTNYRRSLHKSTKFTLPNMQKQEMECGGWLCSFTSISPSRRATFEGESHSLICHNLFKLWQYTSNQLNEIGIQARGLSRLENQRKCRTKKAVILHLRQIFHLEVLPLFNLLSMGGIFICIE